MDDEQQASYDAQASGYCKRAIMLWLVSGWLYAAVVWRLLYLPGVLVFFPGIFVASILALLLFLPGYFAKKRLAEAYMEGEKNWGLLVLPTIWGLVGLVARVIASMGFVELLRYFLGYGSPSDHTSFDEGRRTLISKTGAEHALTTNEVSTAASMTFCSRRPNACRTKGRAQGVREPAEGDRWADQATRGRRQGSTNSDMVEFLSRRRQAQ